MKRRDEAYAWMFSSAMENEREFTQRALSIKTGASTSTIHAVIAPLAAMGAVRVGPRQCVLADPKKALLYWASTRNLQKDVVHQTRVALLPGKIEGSMPAGTVFTAYSAFRLHFGQTPSDYGDVWAYVDDVAEARKRFPPAKGPANLFILEKGRFPVFKNAVSLPHLFADLWNIPSWQAAEHLRALEKRMPEILEADA